MLKVSHLHGFNARRASSSDADFASVVLLMGFEGTDGGTSFSDESPASNTCTAVGNAQIDTAQFKFGTSSALFDGGGDRIDCGADGDADFRFETGDFTVEFWFRLNSTSDDQRAMGCWQNDTFAGWGVRMYPSSNKVDFHASPFGTNHSKTWSVTTGVWYHIAFVRISGTITTYLDGVSLGSTTMTDDIASGSVSDGFALGSLGTYFSGNFDGWIDEVRITKGVGRYTGAFTPPSAAFPRS